MKKILLFLLILTGLGTQAATYYVSSLNGNDSDSGLTTGLAWASLAKVNATAFTAGDTVKFECDSEFLGTLYIKSISGVDATHRVTYKSYGTGAKPIITGFKKVQDWTNKGSNIWESTDTISSLSTANMVTIGGVVTPMGREPELGSVYDVDSSVSNTTITSTDMGSSINWAGAQIVNRLIYWSWTVGEVLTHSGNTITYDDDTSPGTITNPRIGAGFFIQNDSLTLDTQNEWYYNPSTHKIRVYSIGEPVNVKVAARTTGVKTNAGGRLYRTIQDISFTGFNQTAILLLNFDYFILENCTIDKIGWYGVYVNGLDVSGTYDPTTNYTINNCTIKNCGIRAIDSYRVYTISPLVDKRNNYGVITNNFIDSTAMILSQNPKDIIAGIATTDDYVLIENNEILHTGYHAIYCYSIHGQVRNNFIDYPMINRSDGGGIYTATHQTSIVIDGNIVLHSYGYPLGNNNAYLGARGIYLDTGTKYATVTNNTCAFNWEGLYVSTSADHATISGNLLYDNAVSQFHMNNNQSTEDGGNDGDNELNILSNNTFVSKADSSITAYYTSSVDGKIQTFMSSSTYNKYLRPIDEDSLILVDKPSVNYKTLAEWVTFSGEDATSTFTAIVDTSLVYLAYNETNIAKIVTFPWNAKDANGVNLGTSELMQPYESMIVFYDAGINTQVWNRLRMKSNGHHYVNPEGRPYVTR